MTERKGAPTRPTMKVVAEAAGVSSATVSRAFTRPESLLPSTVSKIQREASRLGYVPNHFARALRTGTRNTIALVVPDIANAFFPPLIRGVQAAAGTFGLATVLGDTDEDASKEAPLIRKLAQQVDGVILASSRMPEEMIRALAEEVPLVLVNREIDGLPCILIDSGAGVREASEHLFALGHRSVGYLSGPAASWSDRERQRALQHSAQKHGMRAVILPHRRPDPAVGRQAAEEVLDTNVTAVITFDDILAQGLLTGLIERGLRVPADMSLIGCDDTIAPYTTPPLTSLRALTAQAGEAAVHALTQMITNEQGESVARDSAHVRLPSMFIARSTTAPPRDAHLPSKLPIFS